MNSENYPIDDFGLKMMTEIRRLRNLVEALQTRVNKQDEKIFFLSNEIADLKKYNVAMRQ